MENKAKSDFIEAWGSMGSVWGINTSTARVHALLMVTEEPLGLDEIADQLQISRGNASMCLKELRTWGVIRKAAVPGDRKDYYQSEDDVWKMFFRIARERKRRELDPMIETVRGVLSSMTQEPGAVAARFKQMEELMAVLDTLFTQFLHSDDEARALLSMLSGFAGRK